MFTMLWHESILLGLIEGGRGTQSALMFNDILFGILNHSKMHFDNHFENVGTKKYQLL